MARPVCALTGALMLLAVAASGQDAGNFTSQAMQEAFAAAVAAAGKPHLSYDVLPTERPLLDSMAQLGRNWWSNNFTVLDYMSLETVDSGMEPGVANLTMVYKPLQNVTSEQMVWFFDHLADLNVTLPFDGESYAMYSILHPVDHIRFLASPVPLEPGSKITFQETPNTGCTYDQDSAELPWVCPPDRQGYTRPATPQAVFDAHQQYNSTLTVDEFGQGGIYWSSGRALPEPFGQRNTTTTKLSWRDGDGGLVLRAERLVGVMQPGEIDKFEAYPEDPELVQEANDIVRVAMLDGLFDGNLTAAMWAFANHWAQEWSGLGEWLEPVYELNAFEGGAPDTQAPAPSPTAAPPSGARRRAASGLWAAASGAAAAAVALSVLLA